MEVGSFDEVTLATAARTSQYRLEATEFALDSAVASIRFFRNALEILSIVQSVGFLYVLYLLKGTNSHVHDIVSIIATGISLAVMLLVIAGHVTRWEEQIDKKAELAKWAHKLWSSFDAVLSTRPVDATKISKLNTERDSLMDALKHARASYHRRDRQRGHQHVAMKYASLRIPCTVCQRPWTVDLARLRWKRWVPFIGCEQCGV